MKYRVPLLRMRFRARAWWLSARVVVYNAISQGALAIGRRIDPRFMLRGKEPTRLLRALASLESRAFAEQCRDRCYTCGAYPGEPCECHTFR